jgi:hypothetical protein
MTRTLRGRILTAVLVALMLTVAAASPMLSNISEFGGPAYAGECSGSSC